jgi:hypothetical protein
MPRAFMLLALALGLGLALGTTAGCEDTPPDHPTDGSGPQDMLASGPDLAATDLAAAIEFEDFVLSLINTQTSDTTKPTTTEDKLFFDSMDPSKFKTLFP